MTGSRTQSLDAGSRSKDAKFWLALTRNFSPKWFGEKVSGSCHAASSRSGIQNGKLEMEISKIGDWRLMSPGSRKSVKLNNFELMLCELMTGGNLSDSVAERSKALD